MVSSVCFEFGPCNVVRLTGIPSTLRGFGRSVLMSAVAEAMAAVAVAPASAGLTASRPAWRMALAAG